MQHFLVNIFFTYIKQYFKYLRLIFYQISILSKDQSFQNAEQQYLSMVESEQPGNWNLLN